jgi:drug/metabolite transporter (DMT)-like permease
MTEGNTGFARGFAAVVAGAVTIGTAAIFMRLSEVTPTAAAFWRMTLALPLLYLWMRLDPETKEQRTAGQVRNWVGPSVVVGLWFSADLFMWHWSVDKTTVANATLLANMATVLTAVAGFLFFGQRLQNRFIAGLAFAVIGAFVLVGQNASLNPEYLVGDALGLGTAVAYAGYIIYGAKARATLTTPVVMFGSALVTSAALLPIALMEEGAFFPPGIEGWLPLLGLGWFAHVFGQSLIIYGLAHIPATLGSVTLLIQPVVSAVLAWWIFGERLGPAHLLGAGFIFAGIWLARAGSRNKKAPPTSGALARGLLSQGLPIRHHGRAT